MLKAKRQVSNDARFPVRALRNPEELGLRLVKKPEASLDSFSTGSSGEDPERVITLQVVDDHEMVRIGLRVLFALTPDLRIVAESATKSIAVETALRQKPDLILMDIRLPDGSGIDATREILRANPRQRVLFLTSYADRETVLAALLAGGQGYLLKDTDSETLARSIRTVAAGQPVLDTRVTQYTLTSLRSTYNRGNGLPEDRLSAQERRILPLLAEGKTNKEIAAALGLSDKTVKNYLANVFEKLNISRRTQAAAFFARQAGQSAFSSAM